MAADDIVWSRADAADMHVRVYARSGTKLVELVAMPADLGRWQIDAQWHIEGGERRGRHHWVVENEGRAIELLDAVGIGVTAAIGKARLVEASELIKETAGHG